jgi:hypothetical protein
LSCDGCNNRSAAVKVMHRKVRMTIGLKGGAVDLGIRMPNLQFYYLEFS